YRRHRYLNYGLLSLANSDMASEPSVFHGHFDDPITIVQAVRCMTGEHACIVFLISCPSFLSLEWTKSFIALASNQFPEAKFIVGGRWVVDGNIQFLKWILPKVDRFIEGIG